MNYLMFILILCFSFFADAVESVAVQGTVEGNVVLSAKPATSRDGFRGRYGRPAAMANAPEENSETHSVLVWIEGSSSAVSPPDSDVPVLNQKDQSFVPNLIAVRQNGKVRILNSDPLYHNVFSLSRTKKFDVGRRPKGEYLDVTFDKPGIVDVFCDIHSNMHAVIYVLPSTAVDHVIIQENRSFSISNLQPGDYTLRVFAIGYKETEIPIEISDGKTLTLGTITVSQ